MIFGLEVSQRWMQIPRALIPALLTILFLIVQILPWSRSAEAMVPSFVLMSLFFWSLRTPVLCPLFFVCAIGVAADLTELTPLGSQAIIFVIMTMVLRRHARLGDLSFLRLCLLFAATCLAVNLTLWLIEIVLGGRIVPLGQAVERTAIAAVLYPLLARGIFMPAERLAKDETNG